MSQPPDTTSAPTTAEPPPPLAPARTSTSPHLPHRPCPKGNTHASRGQGYISKHYALPMRRLTPGNHVLVHSTKHQRSQLCVFCRYIRLHKERHAELFERWKISHPRGRVQRTSFECKFCGESLCKEFCFREFHVEY
ncbi:uncharacterized protein H6S33_003673 [Morchella sextelata]|uniref:uncharacterized protein n=1 Tax=Morchella sextelata TaxID=1174677 RepID=UPI001D05A2C0|nr:uncharacterized protein H6S33_003673 [Morchella sextelata]KAH0606839.1 hypothetical protein H6S33_003673 [Morchella sextelata]